MNLTETTLTWRGLTIGGTRASRHWLKSLDGWDDNPDVRRDSAERPTTHGRFAGVVLADERTVTATGSHSSPAERDQIFAELKAVMALSGTAETEPLAVSSAGVTLTADAQLTRFKKIETAWAVGRFAWAAEWACPDPLLYADPTSFPTGFAAATGGLKFPLFTDGTDPVGFLDFGAPSSLGRVTLTNTGTAEARPQLAVAGPVPVEGFDAVCVETGERLTYIGQVIAGSTVVLDSATGRVLLDGTSDRSGNLTVAQWFGVPPMASRTVMFLPRGALSAATMTAIMRCPSW